jgi:hypothetical protein
MIGVRKARSPRLPSLRTGLADLPHPALQSMGYRRAGLEAAKWAVVMENSPLSAATIKQPGASGGLVADSGRKYLAGEDGARTF